MNAAKSFDGFDDLGNDFDAEPITHGLPATMEAASDNKSITFKGEFKEKCPKCAGSGRYHRLSEYGTGCLKCKGTGVLYFKSSAADRAAKRVKAASKAVIKSQQNLAAFEAEHQDVAAWWNGANKDFQFATSLRVWVSKNGSLTDGQMRAAKSCIAKLAALGVARQERAEHAKENAQVNVKFIETAFAKATTKGLKSPKMRLVHGDTSFVVYRASKHSVNAGSLYVKGAKEEGYYGKITAGVFYRGRDVSPEREADIVKACSAPDVAAVAYGRRTGECSCCGRELTNHESIERGIGPICYENFF